MTWGEPARTSTPRAPRIVIVGPCASGKSTLAEALRELGFDARVCGQEHSAVRDLWRRMHPDLLVALDVDLATIRARRHPSWSAAIYDWQRERLRSAFAHADLTIDAATVSCEDVVDEVVAHLRRGDERAGSGRINSR